jgi:hypothetical protein
MDKPMDGQHGSPRRRYPKDFVGGQPSHYTAAHGQGFVRSPGFARPKGKKLKVGKKWEESGKIWRKGKWESLMKTWKNEGTKRRNGEILKYGGRGWGGVEYTRGVERVSVCKGIQNQERDVEVHLWESAAYRQYSRLAWERS